MFALSTAASIALGGMFWAWSLHGGNPAMTPRDAARLFGWLCMACTSVGLYFALRGDRPYDRGPALVATLATTFLTGCAVLYLSYLRWDDAMALPGAAVSSAIAAREPEAPPSKAAHPSRPVAPRAEGPVAPRAEGPVAPRAEGPVAPRAKAPHVRPSATTAKGTAPAMAQAQGPCAGLQRLPRYQCLKCSGKSGFSGFLCEENARGEYCAGRDGSEPGCPWRTSSHTE